MAALGFGITQILNRKANQLVDAPRTAFGLLVAISVVLTAVVAATGQLALLPGADLSALAYFVLACLVHFGGGWTLLALSQQRIGVARTGALVSAAPLIATALAALVLGEAVTLTMGLGVLLVTGGVFLLSWSGPDLAHGRPWRNPWYALAVAAIWGSSPLLIRAGLRGLEYPLLGLTVGLVVTTFVYGLTLSVSRRQPPVSRRAWLWMAAGGASGAVAISAQWFSYSLTSVAVAISLQQLAVLVVLVLAPLVFPEGLERPSPSVLLGTGAILVGTLAVIRT